MPIAIAIKIKTGKTSKKPIIEDLCNVVAKPTRKAMARLTPKIVVILLIILFTIFFYPTSYAQKPQIIMLVADQLNT